MFLPTCMYAMCVPGACRGQKKALDLLELELRMVVSHHVGAGNEILVFCKRGSALNS